jgi:hypothetical protein
MRMKNQLSMAIVGAGVCAMAAGCAGPTDTDWPMARFIVDCPPDAANFTVSVDARPESESCDVGEIVILLDPGTYDVVVTPTSASFDFLHATDTITVSAGDTDELIFDDWPTGGFMDLDWTIDDQDPDTGGGCADLSSNGVSLVATVVGGDPADDFFDDVWPCEDGFGLTGEYPLDDYTVVFALLDENDESIADSAPREVSLEVEDQLEDLGIFNFSTN